MRTTITLDDDVAAAIERLRKSRDASFKELVNEALRHGLKQMTGRPKKKAPFRTEVYNAGKPFLPNVDNIGEVLALIEGDDHK